MKNKLLILISIFIILACLSTGYWYANLYKNYPAETISEVAAIEIVKKQFPEFQEYPSNNLPPKSIKTKKTDNGWYVAFVQEGSGVPIIDARCFLVKNNGSITQKEYSASSASDNALVGEFSAEECQPIENVVGGDSDEHGCIGSAGYSWCQAKQKCLRIWEESCEGDSENLGCALENCHGLEIACGSNPPDVCTAIYEIGDKCLQYAKCGMANGQCQQLENSQFTECKSCVQKCINDNKNDNIDLFECENKC